MTPGLRWPERGRNATNNKLHEQYRFLIATIYGCLKQSTLLLNYINSIAIKTTHLYDSGFSEVRLAFFPFVFFRTFTEKKKHETQIVFLTIYIRSRVNGNFRVIPNTVILIELSV